MQIVYICSPDREYQLVASLGSILSSRTEFNKISIYTTGNLTQPWLFQDKRINIYSKPSIEQEFWMTNKTHICSADSEDIVFLDTDTLIFKPLNILFDSLNTDISGRKTTVSCQSTWDHGLWEKYQYKFGAEVVFPYINSGFLVFRNGAHRRLNPKWLEITSYLRGLSNNPFGMPSQANQQALSLACGSIGLTYSLFTKEQHAYGWEKDDLDNCIVYHLGNYNYRNVARWINYKTGILNRNPLLRISYKAKKYFTAKFIRVMTGAVGIF